jgi:GTP-binding protein Era
MTPLERIEEIIREKIYRCLHKEVPYNVRQKNRLLQVVKEAGKPGVLIHQEIQTQTKSHKQLVTGTGGHTLERIRESAERDISKMLKCKVSLHLFVKHITSKNKDWSI